MPVTQEEQELIDSFDDASEPEVQEVYQFDEDLQKEIIGLLTIDKIFLLQSKALIVPEYFTNHIHRMIYKIVSSFYESYKALPSKSQIGHEIKEKFKGQDAKKTFIYLAELNAIIDYHVPGYLTRNYYLDKITNFAKTQAVKNAFSVCLEKIKNTPNKDETWDQVKDILKKALLVDKNFDAGMDYFQDMEERYARMEKKIETQDVFVTGFDLIDSSLNGGGLSRGEIGSIVGPPGSGKSVFLINAAFANMHRGKRVLYLSLEIDKDKVAERFDAGFANHNPWTNDTGIYADNLLQNKNVVFAATKDYISDKEDQKLMVIKHLPAGTMSMSDLQAYFAQVLLTGFQPDLFILDYIGEMKDYPGMPTWESRQKLTRDLRGFASEEQICILTAMQPDAKASEVVKLGGIIDGSNLAESKGQDRPLDCLWTINQTKDEKSAWIARIAAVKHRNGKSGFETYIKVHYPTFRMTEISKHAFEKIRIEHNNTQIVSSSELSAKNANPYNNVKKINQFANDIGEPTE